MDLQNQSWICATVKVVRCTVRTFRVDSWAPQRTEHTGKCSKMHVTIQHHVIEIWKQTNYCKRVQMLPLTGQLGFNININDNVSTYEMSMQYKILLYLW